MAEVALVESEQPTPQDMTDFMEAAFDDLEAEEETPEVKVSEPEEGDVETPEDLEDAEAAPEKEDAVEKPEPDESQTIAAPQSMSAKDRENFAKLSPEAQKWVVDREKEQTADYTRKTMELADKSKGYDRLEQILAPRRQQLAMDGMDDSTAVGQLFALSDFANNDPVGFVKYMLNARQIPLTAITESGGGNATDPQLAAMQTKLQGFENFFTQQQAQVQQQEEAATNADIERFAKENEHYAELESDMVPIAWALRQSSPNLSNADALAKAYKMAIAGNDAVLAKVEAAKAAKAAEDKVKMEKARAAKAAKAAGANVKKTGAVPASKATVDNVEDFIGALVDERMTA